MKFLLFITGFLTFSGVRSQIMGLNQYTFTPSQFNPATTALLYSPSIYFENNSIQAGTQKLYNDTHFEFLTSFKANRKFSIGIGTYLKHSESDKLFQKTKISLNSSIAYILNNHHFSVGLGGSLERYSFNNSIIVTPDHWDPFIGEMTENNSADPLINSFNSLSIGEKIGFMYQFTNRKQNLKFSLTTSHISAGIYPSSDRWFEYFTSFKILQYGNIELHPELYYTSLEKLLSIGSRLRYDFHESRFLDFVVRSNLNNIYSFILQLNTPQLGLGFSFTLPGSKLDIPIQNLSASGIAIRMSKLIKSTKTKKIVPTAKTIHFNYAPDRNVSSNNLTIDSLKSEPYQKSKNTFTHRFHFEFNSSKINDKDLIYLDSLKDILTRNKSLQIIIIGHSDNIGSKKVNERFSLERAQVIKEYLISKNIKSDRIITIGRGDESPLSNNSTPESRARNRRVEFIMYENE